MSTQNHPILMKFGTRYQIWISMTFRSYTCKSKIGLLSSRIAKVRHRTTAS